MEKFAIGEKPKDYFEAYYLDCRMNPNDPNFKRHRLAKGLHHMFRLFLQVRHVSAIGEGCQ